MDRGNNIAPRTHRRRGAALKATVLSVMACLIVCSVVGGSLAWLMTSTDPITNVFTYGDIQITLTETKGEALSNGERRFKMTPGQVIEKDPKLTVKADSEACWLFVEITKSTDKPLDDFIEYAIDDGWTALLGVEGVYYREVDTSTSDQNFDILKDNKVTVDGDVTLEDLKELNDNNYPKMTFRGYAVQRDATIDAIDTAAKAWALAKASNN